MRKVMWLSLAVTGAIALSLTAFWLVGDFGNDLNTVEAVSSGISNRADDGLGEGIKVHGNWELTVSDPDGSNPVVYNFENSFSGATALAALMLPRDYPLSESMQSWQVKFYRSPATAFSGRNAANRLCEPVADVSTNESEQPGVSLGIILKASCTIDGDIFKDPQELSVVTTRTNSITQAGSTWGRSFTSKGLDVPITVAPWQLLAATVYITFE